MRHFAVLAAVACALMDAGAAASAPQHVMSMNVCADEMVLSLLPPQRIASVSYVSREPSQSTLWKLAATVPINYGTAEEVLAQKPDLVISAMGTTPATRMLLRKIHIPLVELPAAENFAEIRNVTRLAGHALGEDAKAEALIRDMDSTLDMLARTAPQKKTMVAAWSGAGAVPGRGTLFDAILTAAGGKNIAASFTDARYGSFDIEQLLKAAPDVVAYGEPVEGPSLGTRVVQNPVVRKIYAGRDIVLPDTLYSCGVPQAAQAAKLLREKLSKIVPRAKAT